jgi:hypothetical protein
MTHQIVERFPKYRSRVLAVLPQDPVFAELSEDYDRVVAALELEAESPRQQGTMQQQTYRELLRLKRGLEFELLERLATTGDKLVVCAKPETQQR